MVLGTPSMCMSTTGTWYRAATPANSPSRRKAPTSLMMEAPASRAAFATFALVVSMEMGMETFWASFSMMGTTRRISSSAATPSEKGRVDSPPMSRMSAPWRANCTPRATAVWGSKKRPPSEKESGVTLSTAMIRVFCPKSRLWPFHSMVYRRRV